MADDPTTPIAGQAPSTRLELLDEHNQPADEVLLHYIYRGQTLRVSIRRADVDDFAQQRLSPSAQEDLIRRNQETLQPVVEGKRVGGGTTQWTNPVSGQSLPLIELTRADLEQGLRRYPVTGGGSMPIGTALGGEGLMSVGGSADTPLPLRAQDQPPLSAFEIEPEHAQAANFVSLTCLHGAEPWLITVRREDVDDFAQQRLAPRDQDDLIRRNLETLIPVIMGKYNRGEVTQHTNPLTGQISRQIDLTRADLEQGLRRHQVTTSHALAGELLSSNPSEGVTGLTFNVIEPTSNTVALSARGGGGGFSGRGTLTLTPGEPPPTVDGDDPQDRVQSYLITTPLSFPGATLVSLTLRFADELHNLLPEHLTATLSEDLEVAGFVWTGFRR